MLHRQGSFLCRRFAHLCILPLFSFTEGHLRAVNRCQTRIIPCIGTKSKPDGHRVRVPSKLTVTQHSMGSRFAGTTWLGPDIVTPVQGLPSRRRRRGSLPYVHGNVALTGP